MQGTRTQSFKYGALFALALAPAAHARQECPRFLPPETSPGPAAQLAVPGDLDQDGDLDVATSTGLLVNRGDGTFEHVAAPYSGDIRGLAVADLDLDGAPDLVVSSFTLDTVQVWIHQGGLLFSGLPPVAAGDGPYGLEAGDVDGDGDRDVVVAAALSSGARVLLNQGGGLLSPGPTLATGMTALDVALGDFQPDGDLDLLVSGENPSLVVTFWNDGAGSFTNVAQIGISNHWPRTVQAARIDADLDLDAVVTLANGNALVVFSNPGNGIMTNFVPLPTSGVTYSAAVGDVDLDGDPDLLAVTGADFGGLAYFQNLGNGAFAPAQERPHALAQSVVLGRFDLDVRLDAVVTAGTITSLFAGDAQGIGFAPRIVPLSTTPSGQMPTSIDSADFDGDGDGDLVLAGPLLGLQLLRDDGVLGWTVVPLPTGIPCAAIAVRAGDLDADGDMDLVAGTNCGGGGVVTLLNSGGTFTAGPVLPQTGGVPELVLADVDADGDLDITSLGALPPPPPPFPPFADSVFTFLNDGTGAFAAAGSVTTGTRANSITTGDFDGDGRVDVAVACLVGAPVRVHLRQASGLLGSGPAPACPAPPNTIRAADLDGDLDLDLAVGLWLGSPAVAVLRNSGAGVFAAPETLSGAAGNFGAAGMLDAGDLDGDGDSDLALTGFDGTLMVVENQGGTLVPRRESSGVLGSSLALEDLNLDGRLDMIVGYGGEHAGQALRAGVALLTQEPPCAPYRAFCFGDGTGAPCPCGNASPVGAGAGCLSSIGAGGVLDATGTPSLTADTLLLSGSMLPASTSALFVQGSAADSTGFGTPLADGLRCVFGSLVRLGTRTASGGVSGYGAPVGDAPVSVRGGIALPGTVAFYQVYYRNVAPFCTPATANLTNGIVVAWRP